MNLKLRLKIWNVTLLSRKILHPIWNYLKKHFLIHAGEKSHKCAKFKTSFRQKSHLVNHIVSYHRRKKELFECDICNMAVPYEYKKNHETMSHWNNTIGDKLKQMQPMWLWILIEKRKMQNWSSSVSFWTYKHKV